ncbi:hypothetical protein DPMN_021703 [Dreissena polymorpha]|uniref:Uncharacterized protein n=1 Tax=Dreissena polymorpha TaxID=45954 RepID=A0A9D4NL86_DREPO|nr:hypothetical protein DPMN_021703 [Dreissena polymorpha]
MSMAELTRRLTQLDIRDICECRCWSLLDIRLSSKFETFPECRCKSWLDIRPSSITETFDECGYQSLLEIRPS